MAKRYDEDIEVTLDPIEPRAPLSFRWRGRRYEIDRRLETWREAEVTSARPRAREYHRVLARPAGTRATGECDPDGSVLSIGAVYDVYRDHTADTWRLARVWD